MPTASFLRLTGRRAALAAALLLVLAQPGPRADAQSRPQQLVQPSVTLAQRLRRLLNLSPPLAVGGSRSGAGQRVCLLSPWPTTPPRGQKSAVALVPTTTPLLLTDGPLNEIQILRDDRIVWQQRASSTSPISGPLAWPLAPLQPSEQVVLRLRSRGAAGADFAEIRLQAPSAERLQRYQQLLGELQANPSRWPGALDASLRTDPALAVALAGDANAPAAIQQSWHESTIHNDCR